MHDPNPARPFSSKELSSPPAANWSMIRFWRRLASSSSQRLSKS